VLTNKIRLNIGAGQSNLPGFIPLDIQTGTDASGKLPYGDGTVDEIYCSHCLEHIHHSKVYETLKEWVRVLRPGGRIRIAVPDWEQIFEKYRNGHIDTGLLNAWLHGTHPKETDRHQFVGTREEIEAMLRSLGIEDIGPWAPEYPDCSTIPDSLNVGGRKRVTVIKDKPVVAMVLSTNRLGFTDLYPCVTKLSHAYGWPLYQWGGDNWEKALTGTIKGAIAEVNPDYILTLDFDSVFEPAEIAAMVDWMQQHPEVMAAWPVQAHRHQNLPLGYAPAAGATNFYNFAKDNPWQGEFTPYGSGHFGCTIIRRQVFDAMEQPWFAGIPTTTPTGVEWNRSSLDNDLSFWISMQAHGMLFGQLNNFQIGHMELAVKWVAGDKIIWQQINLWRKNGRPKEAVFDGEKWNALMRKVHKIPEPPQGSPELSAPPPPTEEVVAEVHRKAMDLNIESDVMTECERLAEQRRRSQPISYQCGCGRPDPECQCGPRTVGEKEEAIRRSKWTAPPLASTNMASYWNPSKVAVKPDVIDTAQQIINEKLRNASMANGRV
jgi:predicted SAM-dependent methyltransferase